jgi:hypothetical protein
VGEKRTLGSQPKGAAGEAVPDERFEGVGRRSRGEDQDGSRVTRHSKEGHEGGRWNGGEEARVERAWRSVRRPVNPNAPLVVGIRLEEAAKERAVEVGRRAQDAGAINADVVVGRLGLVG